MSIEPLLLTTTRISTFFGSQSLTAATGFFFEREQRLYLATSRHVLHDEDSGHLPDRIELVLHLDADNLARTAVLSVLLYRDGHANWHQGEDAGGPIDVAVLELDRSRFPAGVVLHAFRPEHLQLDRPEVEVGASLRVVGFPLGFYDTHYHLPVVRHAIIASAFGVRFQGQGYFLTDGRMHRGSSGGPVVMRSAAADPELPWRLLGVHAAGLDMKDRNRAEDEALGLNCTWYADILMTLTAPPPAATAAPAPAPARLLAAAPPAPTPRPA